MLFSVQIADEKAEKKQEEMRYKTRTTQKKEKENGALKVGAVPQMKEKHGRDSLVFKKMIVCGFTGAGIVLVIVYMLECFFLRKKKTSGPFFLLKPTVNRLKRRYNCILSLTLGHET